MNVISINVDVISHLKDLKAIFFKDKISKKVGIFLNNLVWMSNFKTWQNFIIIKFDANLNNFKQRSTFFLSFFPRVTGL